MRPSPAPVEQSSPASLDPMPKDIHNVYIYEMFNTASWSVVLGSPMLLYFQHLNASATILAIAAWGSTALGSVSQRRAAF